MRFITDSNGVVIQVIQLGKNPTSYDVRKADRELREKGCQLDTK
jgi:hypothetical protein